MIPLIEVFAAPPTVSVFPPLLTRPLMTRLPVPTVHVWGAARARFEAMAFAPIPAGIWMPLGPMVRTFVPVAEEMVYRVAALLVNTRPSAAWLASRGSGPKPALVKKAMSAIVGSGVPQFAGLFQLK